MKLLVPLLLVLLGFFVFLPVYKSHKNTQTVKNLPTMAIKMCDQVKEITKKNNPDVDVNTLKCEITGTINWSGEQNYRVTISQEVEYK